MQISRIGVLAAVLLFCASTVVFSQTFGLQFVEVTNDGTNLDVQVQIRAYTSSFAIGTSNLFFSYNDADLSNPTIIGWHNYSGGAYQTIALGGTGTSRSVNIELNTAGTGSTVPTSYTPYR